MTQPIHLLNDVYAVEVPEGATDVGFRFECLTCILPGQPGRYKWLTDIEQWMEKQGGEWEVIGPVRECTELQAACIVDSDGTGWCDYLLKDGYPFSSVIDSLRSLLASKALDTNKNWVLVRKG